MLSLGLLSTNFNSNIDVCCANLFFCIILKNGELIQKYRIIYFCKKKYGIEMVKSKHTLLDYMYIETLWTFDKQIPI